MVHEERSLPERWTFIIGTDGKLMDIITDVDTGAHGAQIAKRLHELGVATR